MTTRDLRQHLPFRRRPSRRQFLSLLGAGAAGAGALATGVALFPDLAIPGAEASNHRSAPLIRADPVADCTDVYAFVSPDKPDTVTLIANWIPLEQPAGAPYFYNFGDDVLYEIKIDNNGDALPEITYQFTFKSTITNPNTFLYNTGPITSLTDPNWNLRQRMSVAMVDRTGKSTPLGTDLPTPPNNIGPKSTPDYGALAAAAVTALPSGQSVFAGPRADPFFVDLGSIFDLLTIRRLPGNAGGGANFLNGFNVHSIVIQAPITQLTANGSKPTDPKDPNAVIGVWATASRRSMRVLNPGTAATSSGDWVQVVRLGSPLVNETVIPTGKKDLFNAVQPSGDAQFLSYVTDPEPARLLNALYKIKVPPTPRDDLVAVFLTGIKGLTMPANVKPAEMLRLNLAVPVSGTPDRLGVLAGDVQGYPNGRRLNDDVVDISLQALAGAAYPLFHPGFTPDPLADKLGDGVDGPASPPMPTFPYVAPPYQGFTYSAGEATAPSSGPTAGAPASGIAELGKSSSSSLAGNSGGAFAAYQISGPSGGAVTLTLSYSPVDGTSGAGIDLEVYQNGSKLGSATDAANSGTITLKLTPASGSAVLIKVGNYIPGLTITFTLTRS
ncbi:MAG TPA: DUF4331 domain-containing protein [Chloroflexota bacterium]|nr:DUF4331 domain-containing protein [Chloroflexota bacterium]